MAIPDQEEPFFLLKTSPRIVSPFIYNGREAKAFHGICPRRCAPLFLI